MDLQSEVDWSLHVDGSIMCLCPFWKAMIVNKYKLRYVCMKNIIGQFFFSTYIFYLEKKISAKLDRPKYESAIGCETLLKSFRTVAISQYK